jgi:hypothetical protein
LTSTGGRSSIHASQAVAAAAAAATANTLSPRMTLVATSSTARSTAAARSVLVDGVDGRTDVGSEGVDGLDAALTTAPIPVRDRLVTAPQSDVWVPDSTMWSGVWCAAGIVPSFPAW